MHAEPFVPALGWALPFVVLLLSIAVLPLAAPHFWECNLRKLAVCALLAAPVLVLYLRAYPQALVHTAVDYVSFLLLPGGGRAGGKPPPPPPFFSSPSWPPTGGAPPPRPAPRRSSWATSWACRSP